MGLSHTRLLVDPTFFLLVRSAPTTRWRYSEDSNTLEPAVPSQLALLDSVGFHSLQTGLLLADSASSYRVGFLLQTRLPLAHNYTLKKTSGCKLTEQAAKGWSRLPREGHLWNKIDLQQAAREASG